MPILQAEPALYPPDLFDPTLAEPAVAHRSWWVLHTKPRQEKSLARHLCGREVPFYLPLLARRLRTGGRVMTSHVPLFAGYTFLLATPEERLAALASQRVVRCLAVGNQQQLWEELRQIQRLIASGVPLTAEDRLVPGAAVEIRRGPLAGLKGTILRTASGRKFVVQVDFIQKGASVVLDDFALEGLS